MNTAQVTELLLQSLQHEKGGTLVYQTALKCVVNADLREEWERYLEETTRHVEVLTSVCADMGIDPEMQTPGRTLVEKMGASLVSVMEEALDSGPAQAAQLVACDCVVLAETRDHANWELIGRCADHLDEKGTALQQAYDEIEDQEDEHLYHSKGWSRELWIESLGLSAILPPPEEQENVQTAIEAAEAQQASEQAR